MSDQLLPGSVRRAATEAAVAAENANPARKAGVWSAMDVKARAAMIAVGLLVLAVITIPLGVGILVGSVVSVVAGLGAGVVAFGITLFVIGILLGLNS